jgi:hypothetical protein
LLVMRPPSELPMVAPMPYAARSALVVPPCTPGVLSMMTAM